VKSGKKVLVRLRGPFAQANVLKVTEILRFNRIPEVWKWLLNLLGRSLEQLYSLGG
jgi:hypothetical protein